MKIRKIIKEYFSYSASEKRGLLILVIVLLGVYVVPVFFSSSNSESKILVKDKQQEIQSLISSIEQSKSKQNQYNYFSFDPNSVTEVQLNQLGLSNFQIKNLIRYRKAGGIFYKKGDLLKIYGFTNEDLNLLDEYITFKKIQTVNRYKSKKVSKISYLFPFDPNTLSYSGWDSLGVDSKIANRIQKYIEKGGSFKEAKDLKKIYGFDSAKLLVLMPYINIDLVIPEKIDKEYKLIELNSSDTSELKKLPGIGKVLSSRIIKYRKLLGGYSNKEQLIEVYGISKERYLRFSGLITVDSSLILKMGINSFNKDKLKSHPYIKDRIANDIVRYRHRMGDFNSVEELKDKGLLSDSIFGKLSPYLSLD